MPTDPAEERQAVDPIDGMAVMWVTEPFGARTKGCVQLFSFSFFGSKTDFGFPSFVRSGLGERALDMLHYCITNVRFTALSFGSYSSSYICFIAAPLDLSKAVQISPGFLGLLLFLRLRRIPNFESVSPSWFA